MNYLDRNNIATARLAGNPGMEEDLGLTDSQYETAVSILYVINDCTQNLSPKMHVIIC
jgi:hypothetical protein